MTAKIFRPLAHSVKIETREKISLDKRVPRLILDDIETASNSILHESIDMLKQEYLMIIQLS